MPKKKSSRPLTNATAVGGKAATQTHSATNQPVTTAVQEPVDNPDSSALSGAVSEAAVVTASTGKRWMVVQGLDQIGYPTWHLTIFPVDQERWTGTYRLPANGTRGIASWMRYDEFHLTSPDGVHFFYTHQCVPLAASQQSRGTSPEWSSTDLWGQANYLCAYWFNTDLNYLNAYVAERPRVEAEEARERRAEQAHQERLWNMYKKWIETHPELYAKTSKTFDEWIADLEQPFMGSHAEFREVIQRDYEEYMSAVNSGTWRDDEGGYGYV